MHNAQQNNKNKKTTPAQFSVLVKEMENNPNIGQTTPTSGFTRPTRETFWNGLAYRLNALGPKKRTTGEWKKVWSELKLRTKRKIADSNTNLADMENGTGSNTESLYDGHMIDQTLQVKSDTAGTPTGNTLRVQREQEEASTSSRSSVRYECESLELLRRQVETEEKLVKTLNRSNELKQQQLRLMAEQNKLISTTIESVNNLSVKFNKFLENNN